MAQKLHPGRLKTTTSGDVAVAVDVAMTRRCRFADRGKAPEAAVPPATAPAIPLRKAGSREDDHEDDDGGTEDWTRQMDRMGTWLDKAGTRMDGDLGPWAH